MFFMKPDTLALRVAKLRDAIIRTDMPRSRSYGKELECFFEGIDLENLLIMEGKALELGCGYGGVLRYMQQRFKIEPHGIDLAFYGDWKDFLSSLTRFGEGIRFKKGDVTSLPYANSEFDFIFSYKTFFKVPDKLRGVKEAHRVLKMGGTAVLELDVYTDDDARYLQPKVEDIVKAYPNSGQLDVTHVGIWDGKFGFYAQPVHLATRAVIKKTSEQDLEFPELKDFKVNSSWRGVEAVRSFY